MKSDPAMYEYDCKPQGFEWVDCQDNEQSVVAYLRKSSDADDVVLVVVNFTPVPRSGYRIGVPQRGFWKEVLNSDATVYGGSGVGNYGGVWSDDWAKHGHDQSISLTLPPLSMVILKAAVRE
jgi:1,4-alpha-glucan branching enzyme